MVLANTWTAQATKHQLTTHSIGIGIGTREPRHPCYIIEGRRYLIWDTPKIRSRCSFSCRPLVSVGRRRFLAGLSGAPLGRGSGISIHPLLGAVCRRCRTDLRWYRRSSRNVPVSPPGTTSLGLAPLRYDPCAQTCCPRHPRLPCWFSRAGCPYVTDYGALASTR